MSVANAACAPTRINARLKMDRRLVDFPPLGRGGQWGSRGVVIVLRWQNDCLPKGCMSCRIECVASTGDDSTFSPDPPLPPLPKGGNARQAGKPDVLDRPPMRARWSSHAAAILAAGTIVHGTLRSPRRMRFRPSLQLTESSTVLPSAALSTRQSSDSARSVR